MRHWGRLGHLLRSNAPHFTSLVSVVLHTYLQEVIVSNSSFSRCYPRTSFNSSLPSFDGYPIYFPFIISIPFFTAHPTHRASSLPPLEKNYFKSLKTLGNDCKHLNCLQKTRMKLHLAIEDTVLMVFAKEIKLICLIFLDFKHVYILSVKVSCWCCKRKFEI